MSEPSEAAALITAPIPVARRRGLADIGAVFRLGNFRRMFVSGLSSSIAGWMSRVAQDWILLDLTHNVAMVGLAITFQFLPILIFGLWGGVLADRFSRLRVARIAHVATTSGLVAIAVLALLGTVQVWHIYLVAAVSGLTAVVEAPARSALVTQIVPGDRIQTAISLNALTFHASGLVGPAVSGILIAAVGAGWSLLTAACLSLVSLSALLSLRARELSTVARATKQAGVGDALRYAWRKPPILWTLVLLAFVSTFGMTHTVLYAAAASAVGFDSGAAGYGLYMAMGAVGAVTGAALSTQRRTVSLRGVAGAALCFGVAMLFAAASPVQGVFVIAVVLLSTARILFGTGAESLVQMSTNPMMRGRVASLYFVILTGGQAGGAVLVGWVAQTFGIHAAYVVAGGVPLLAAVVVTVIVATRRGLVVRFDVRRPLRPIRIERRRGAVVRPPVPLRPEPATEGAGRRAG